MTGKGLNFLMNVLPDVKISPIKKKSETLLPQGTANLHICQHSKFTEDIKQSC